MSGFVYRKFWHFDRSNSVRWNRSLIFEISGFSFRPSVSLKVDGGERKYTIGIGFLVSIYITLEGFFSSNFYPQDKRHGSNFPGRRDTYLRISDGCIYWNIWKDDTYWSSKDSKIRHGNIDLKNIFLGKHSCEFIELRKEEHLISFIEGQYNVEVTQSQRVDKRARWFTKKSICYSVNCGRYQNGVWVDSHVPVQGKGENSWDCGEGGTGSMNFPSRNLKDCKEASIYFQESIKKNRIRYGGKDWVPKFYRKVIERNGSIDKILGQ